MAGETLITVVGNLTADPELKYTQSGKAVVNFTVASTPRTFNRQSNEWEDGDALFLRCSQWNESGENVAGSLTKGARVIVQGYLKQRSWETREGEKRTGFELEVADVGPSLKYATAQVTRRARGQAAPGRGGQADPWGAPPAQQQQADPWGAPPQQQAGAQQAWATPGSYDDETPF